MLVFGLLALVLCAPLFAPRLFRLVRDRFEDRRAMRRPEVRPVGQYVADRRRLPAPVGWARDLERLRTEDVIYAMGLLIHTVGT